MQSKGAEAGVAHTQAMAVMERTLGSQASLIAFEKAYFALGVLFIAALPLLFLFKKVKPGGAAGGAH
jgi:DHA2 family multidrug resistance protein